MQYHGDGFLLTIRGWCCEVLNRADAACIFLAESWAAPVGQWVFMREQLRNVSEVFMCKKKLLEFFLILKSLSLLLATQ